MKKEVEEEEEEEMFGCGGLEIEDRECVDHSTLVEAAVERKRNFLIGLCIKFILN